MNGGDYLSNLENLSKDKLIIMERLLQSKNICKALYYNNRDFLDQPDIEDVSELIFKNIFPYRKVPNVNDDMRSYITLSFGNYKPVRNSFKFGLITLFVFTHMDLVETDYEALRTDYLISEIEKVMNGKNGIGIGKAEFYDMDEIQLNDSYLGYYITYKIYEFN